MTPSRILQGLDEVVRRLANDEAAPDGWTPDEWAYVQGIASGQILTLVKHLRETHGALTHLSSSGPPGESVQ